MRPRRDVMPEFQARDFVVEKKSGHTSGPLLNRGKISRCLSSGLKRVLIRKPQLRSFRRAEPQLAHAPYSYEGGAMVAQVCPQAIQ